MKNKLLAVAIIVTVLNLTLPSCVRISYGNIVEDNRTNGKISSCPINGTLRISDINPRYFTDNMGKAVYLTGSHTWNSLQDINADDVKPLRKGFEGYLVWLQQHNHNFTRMWILEHAWDQASNAVVQPLPWQRVGPDDALDGKPKFDLTQFDDSFFARLRERVASACQRGVYVSVMLFDDWSTENRGAWQGHPFNVKNNINGINGDPNDDGLGIEFHTLENPRITQLQRAYIKRVVDTLNEFDNVLYEIANETGVSKEWQYHMISLVKEYESAKPKQHSVGSTVGWPVIEFDNAALFASPADWISPNSEGGYKDNPPAADGTKIIIADSDHLWGIGGDRTWIWKSFMRGLNPIYMDRPNDHSSNAKEVRRAMGQTQKYARRMNLAAMTPETDLASSGYCLANPGNEYLVYVPRSEVESEHGSTFWSIAPVIDQLNSWLDDWLRKSVTVDLSQASGKFAIEWFSPRTGQTIPAGRITGGTVESFKAPFPGDAVLYIAGRQSSGGA
jgi:hypothetical protein